MDTSRNETRLLVKICNLYYVQGKSQQEIADSVGVSRPQVSRFLSKARESGIVTITIRDPFSEEHQYEQTLAQKYGLLDALVVDTHGELVSQQMADEVTALLNSTLKDDNIFGVMTGSTINILSQKVGKISKKNISIVPMTGGTGESDPTQANINVKNFADVFKCRYYQLNAPAFVFNGEITEGLLNEPAIKNVLDLARNASVALVGIGNLDDADYGISREIEEIRRRNGVANLCGSFLNDEGKSVEYDKLNIIGIRAEELKRIPKVIAIAMGEEKIRAIKAVLEGKWIDILVTDLDTAKKL